MASASETALEFYRKRMVGWENKDRQLSAALEAAIDREEDEDTKNALAADWLQTSMDALKDFLGELQDVIDTATEEGNQATIDAARTEVEDVEAKIGDVNASAEDWPAVTIS